MKIINTNTYSLEELRKRTTEDLEILDMVDKVFITKRGYVIKIPTQGSPVLACMSGGLDSTVNVAMLLEEFRLEVYPFFVNRGQSNYKWEKKALEWYDNYFQKRYPELYHPVKEIDLIVPSKSYKNMLRATKHLQDDPELRARITYPARNPIMFLAGMEYGYSLQSKGVSPKALFIAEHKDDTSIHGSLTLMRITNLMMCCLLNDWNFQFISIPIERELGNLYGKDVFVKYADSIGLPLEHTRSCCDKTEIQCGECCMACFPRRMAFKKAGVEDKTKYLNPMPASEKECRKDTAENWKGIK